jgi:bla regulator protein BlaR1
LRRQDNLTTAIHMLVETIFWFHPLVWWIRTQMIAERERACDEEVVRNGNDPQVYAEGILNVCKFYLSSPARCTSGVTGADLKKRIESILTNRSALNLSFGTRFLLFSAGYLAVAGPITVGVLGAPPNRGRSQDQTAPAAFAVASVKPNRSGGRTIRRVEPGSSPIWTLP